MPPFCDREPIELCRGACQPRAARERGFALILVIWVMTLLAALAAAVAADFHSDTTVARNRLALAQARASADAGVALAVTRLLDPDLATRWPADGRSRAVSYAGAAIALRVDDEDGKVDLNNAPIEMIAGLLEEFGAAPDRRMAIAAAIVARRRAVAASSRGIGPSDRFVFRGNNYFADFRKLAFADISELQSVPGMTHALYDRLRPYITTYSQSATVNPMTAARATLLVIPGISPQEVDPFLAARDTVASAAAPQLAGGGRYVRAADPRVVTISAQATIAGRARFTREAVVMVSPGLQLQSLRILQWRERVEDTAAAPR